MFWVKLLVIGCASLTERTRMLKFLSSILLWIAICVSDNFSFFLLAARLYLSVVRAFR